MSDHIAECSCGQLSARCEGDPVRVSVCHCLACKRRTGSAFSHNARFPVESVTVKGRFRDYTRIGDEEGAKITYSFCPECGVTVLYRIDQFPETVAIPVGVFGDLDFPEPTVSVFDPSRRYDWVEVCGDRMERLD